jgi:hypothetical protein
MDWVVIKGNVPSKSNSYRIITLNGHGSLAKTKALKAYEESFFWQCGEGELPTHGRADGLGFKGHHSYQCRQFALIFPIRSR